MYCGKCGSKNEEGKDFCVQCGESLKSNNSNIENVNTNENISVNTNESTNVNANEKGSINIKIDSKTLIIIGAVILVIVVVMLLKDNNGGNGKSKISLRTVYSTIGCNSTYCKVGSDGSYLEIDTNPNNLDDYFSSSALNMVKSANKECGFDESLYTRMSHTRALDGTQTEEIDNFKVTWTYHPDNGLNVVYSAK